MLIQQLAAPDVPARQDRDEKASRYGTRGARQARLIDAAIAIRNTTPDRLDFLHSVMCQVGLPRRRTDSRSFERHNGHVSIRLDAGSLFDGHRFVDQPLPYGPIPRLVMVHISSEAVRTRRRAVEVGDSMRQFLLTLGMQSSGGRRGSYRALRNQIQALAACRLTIGMQADRRVTTLDVKPIKRFDAWLHADGSQQTLWPGSLELSAGFYNSLADHAVPLDHRALAKLKHSALALDIYTWLAHRLCRVSKLQGVRLSWANLREQFGQEYRSSKDFKKEFRHALRQVEVVYPEARIGDFFGGLTLHPSPPPLRRTLVIA